MPTVGTEAIKVGQEEDGGPSLGFAQSLLRLFNGPRVKLRLTPSGTEYEVSLELIREKSPYFAKMFQDYFIEGIKGEATLEEIDGVVSPCSLENLLRWIYCEKIILISKHPQDQISEGLELLRIADMCDVHGVEQILSDCMQDILKKVHLCERPRIILPEHIKSTSLLPHQHPFRSVIAKSLAGPVIKDEAFALSLFQCPAICPDILKEVRAMCLSADGEATKKRCPSAVAIIYRDPLSPQYVRVQIPESWELQFEDFERQVDVCE